MSSMLKKKEVFTIITPIPDIVPRQLAIDILHSHSEVITLNPLVLDHKPIKAPRHAASDEYYSTWYEITECIQYIPGFGRMGSGKISFNGCFHDMPWGLQTHVYAPMGVDLRNRYRIAGNEPRFEPPEQPEIGLAALGAPSNGLYLRDDVEIKCNVVLVSFVKKQLKAASKEMVSRIIKTAELLDAGVLRAMFYEGKLKTINPNDRTNVLAEATTLHRQSSPSLHHEPGAVSPSPVPYQVPRHTSYQHYSKPGTPVQNPHWSAPYGGKKAPHPSSTHAELPGRNASSPGQQAHHADSMPVEMPGDFSYPQPSPRLQLAQPSPTYNSDHDSTTSGRSSRVSPRPDWLWSQSPPPSHGGASRPASMSSDVSSVFHSPGLEQQGFSSDLATHNETPEEHNDNGDALRRLHPAARGTHASPKQNAYPYNPADYARIGTPPAHSRSKENGYSS